MRIATTTLGALIFAAAPAITPALAEDTAPPPAITINATAALVSDYRFRGISQTDKNAAVQGSVTVTHKSGFYVSFWGSSTDSYVTFAGTGHQEIDLIGGYKKTYHGATFDVGALYYFYPKTHPAGDRSSSDFIEPYADVSYVFGPVTAKATVNYAPKQKALSLDQGASGTMRANDNTYLAGDFSAAIPHSPIGLTAHIGHTWGPSWISTGVNGRYFDWGAGATITYKALTLGVAYVDTDANTFYTSKNATKSGVVGSLTASF